MSDEKTSGSFNLQTVGVFIGTHGLAVFLVVYFTLFLYPKMESERGEWIRDITELKQLVNPATRPVTAQQAEAILNIVASNFVGYLYSWQSNSNQSSTGSDYFYFGRESFKYPDPAVNAPLDTLAGELENDIARFSAALRVEASDRQDRLRNQLANSVRATETQVYQLALIRFGDASLKESWSNVTKTAEKLWLEYSSDDEARASCSADVEYFYRYVERHPGYATLKKAKPEAVVPPKMQPPKIKDNNQLIETIRAAISDEIHQDTQMGPKAKSGI